MPKDSTHEFETTSNTRIPHAAYTARDFAPARPSALSMILFTAFAIPVSIVAISAFTIGGIVLAGFIAYQWVRVAGLQRGTAVEKAVEALSPAPSAPKSSGNASFDAYREELLERLEREQSSFEDFLTRLRAAKDKSEFDDFMEDRASRSRTFK